MSFQKNKYIVIKKAISPQLAKFVAQYFLLKRNVARRLFDERFIWAVDVDLYKRLYDKYGTPTILNEVTVVIRLWERQMTHLISNDRKEAEISLSTRKHEHIEE